LPVGFACGLVRGEWWFLSTLFILPEFQAQGIGRALLERAKAGYPTPSGIAATMTDALQPKSNTLYARHGMFPRLPAVVFTGPLRPGLERPRLGNLEVRPLTLDDLPALLQIDADVTGLDRTPDHASYLGEAEWPGWLFSRAGQPTGYTYIRPGGAIGPAATVRSGDMERVMQYALVEVAAYQPAAVRVIVPGPNTAAQRPLWAAGLVFDEVPGLILMSRPFGHFDRYVCASFGMM
jgi:hypothetical protein